MNTHILTAIINPTTADLRRLGNEAEARSRAAKRDGDWEDAAKWEQKAIQHRRQAREREFGGLA